jgi:hypothetical protein
MSDSNDPGLARVVVDGSIFDIHEDYWEKLRVENPVIYEAVTSIIPSEWSDVPKIAAMLTGLAVSLTQAAAKVTPGARVATIACYGGSMALLNTTIDVTLEDGDGVLFTEHDIARAIAAAVVSVVGEIGIVAGLAAIGVSGIGGVLLGAALTVGAMAVIGQVFDVMIDPYSKTEISEDRVSYKATTVLTFDEYFLSHWDDLSGYEEWRLDSEKSETEILYIGSEDTYQFSTSQIDEKTFYQILAHEDNNFGVTWDGAGSPISDIVINYYNDTVAELKASAESSNQALFALVSLRPFVLQTEQLANYNALDPSAYSENYLQDRAQFLYASVNGNPDSIRYEQRGEDGRISGDIIPI